MNFWDRFKMAFRGVSSNKFRSFLTLLGIIIGVGAVILMVSLGSGTREVVTGQINDMNTRQIYLSTNYELPYSARGKLTLEEKEFLEKSSPDITNATPFYRYYTQIKYKGKETGQVQIGGVRSNAIELTSKEIKYGRNFTQDDISQRKQVAIVGEAVLEKIDDSADLKKYLGQEIKLEDKSVVIIGIYKRSNASLAFGNEAIFIPGPTFKKFWRYRARDVGFYLISYSEDVSENDVISQIHYLLNKKYGTHNDKNRFRTEGLQGQVDVTNKIFTVLTYVLGGIAAISLLVGGIGVMNIMLVSVKERTREIGVRMAIGATGTDIQHQFLFEAIILSIGGGIIGIIIGSLLSFGTNIVISHYFTWWQGIIPIWVILLSFGVTVTIGLVFGFYPAYKASKLDPIEALRYE